ncbi:unnamed protein product [Caenorhabditis auriculariae]|uniref:Uncharacterized protein n=1 Tax=Caenorhabditis auriculariae TaxID=2777116 RepID=A0A8S1HDP2_9PELO|nr:unnamed protein product [Caenorhabditis auriculariae]
MEAPIGLFHTIYFTAYFIISISQQLLLVHIMIRYTPRRLRGLRFFMIKSSVVEIVLICLIYFTQYRYVVNTNTLAIICHGPSEFFSANICFYSFFAVLVIGAESVLSVAHTIYYQFRHTHCVLKPLSLFAIIRETSISFIPLIVLQVMVVLLSKNFSAVKMELYQLHPEETLSSGVIAGFDDMFSPLNICALFMIGIIVYGTPLFSMYCKKRIHRQLFKCGNSISKKTRENSKTFIQALNFQAMIPAICYVPPFSMFLYSQYIGSDPPYYTYIVAVMISAPTILHPAATIYFVLPYRRAVVSIFMRSVNRKSSGFNGSSENSNTQTV